MYHQLATRFARNVHQITGRTPLDNDALRSHVPQARRTTAVRIGTSTFQR
jgi:hypothetical protein